MLLQGGWGDLMWCSHSLGHLGQSWSSWSSFRFLVLASSSIQPVSPDPFELLDPHFRYVFLNGNPWCKMCKIFLIFWFFIFFELFFWHDHGVTMDQLACFWPVMSWPSFSAGQSKHSTSQSGSIWNIWIPHFKYVFFNGNQWCKIFLFFFVTSSSSCPWSGGYNGSIG